MAPPRQARTSSASSSGGSWRSAERTAAASPVDPAGRYVLFRERFADLARLGAAPAARLLDAASGALALAASLTDSRRNVKLSTEAFALGL